MKKVVYSLRKLNGFKKVDYDTLPDFGESRNSYKNMSTKKTGIAYISDSGDDLIIYPNTQYERVIEDCIRYCYPVFNKPNQYSGTFSQFIDVDFLVKESYESKELEFTYSLWFKVLD